MSATPSPQPKTDFISCLDCQQTFAAYRSPVCPHPIPRGILPSRQIIAGNGDHAAIATIPRPKRKPGPKKTGKRPPLVLVHPEWERQKGETALNHAFFEDYREQGEARALIKVALKWRRHYSQIRRVARADKWEVRVHEYDKFVQSERLAIARKIQRRRVERNLAIIDCGTMVVAAEFDTLVEEIVEKRQSAGMSLPELTAAYEKLVKLGQLLTGQATEHVLTDTAEAMRERQFRGTLTNIQDSMKGFLEANPQATEEEIDYMRNRYIDLAVELSQIDRAVLVAAIDGTIDESSTATN